MNNLMILVLLLSTYIIGQACAVHVNVNVDVHSPSHHQANPDTQELLSSELQPQSELNEVSQDSVVIPLTQSNWKTAYNGYGYVRYAGNGVTFAPKSATSPSKTHAVLLLTSKYTKVKDFELTIEVSTLSQTRVNSAPNTWECFWVFFNYNPVGSKKKTNYFVIKPNGIELGTAFDEVGQRFLFTKGSPRLKLGKYDTITIIKQGQNINIVINGNKVSSSWISHSIPLYDVPGQIGLYSEDAKVNVRSVKLKSL